MSAYKQPVLYITCGYDSTLYSSIKVHLSLCATARGDSPVVVDFRYYLFSVQGGECGWPILAGGYAIHVCSFHSLFH